MQILAKSMQIYNCMNMLFLKEHWSDVSHVVQSCQLSASLKIWPYGAIQMTLLLWLSLLFLFYFIFENFQAILRPGPQPTSPGRARPSPQYATTPRPQSNSDCSTLAGLYKLSAGGDWKVVKWPENFGLCCVVADHSSLCCKLGEIICLLLQKFSKVRPGPQQATAWPSPRATPARAYLR